MRYKNIINFKFTTWISLSIVVVIIMTSFSLGALNKFYTYKRSVDHNIELTAGLFQFLVKNEMRNLWVKLTAPVPLSDKESPIPTFRITLAQEDLLYLNSDLPRSGKENYVDAYVNSSADNKIRKIKLRYRGDNSFHWLYPQKSLRIKLQSNELYNMEKAFNLINPPMMSNYRDIIYYKFANKLDVLSPDYYPARVFINGKFMGVYNYLSQIDESFLRKKKVMPGSIYYGDSAPVFKSGKSKLWFEGGIYWDKKAARNAEQKQNRDDISYFIDTINQTNDLEFYHFVETMLDKNKFFNYIALDRIFGSNHHTYGHNHKIYFDPYRGKFEPIAWDLRFWGAPPDKDASVYTLVRRIAANPLFDVEIDKIVYALIKDGFLNKVSAMYGDFLFSTKRDLQSDFYKDDSIWLPAFFQFPPWYSTVYSVSDLENGYKTDINTLQKRINILMGIFNDSKVQYEIVKKERGKYSVYFNVGGNSPILLKFSDDFKDKIYKIKNKNKILVDADNVLYPGRFILEDGKIVTHDTENAKSTIKNRDVLYEFIVESSKEIELSKLVKITNEITGEVIHPEKSTINKNVLSDGIHPWKYLNNDINNITLSGTIEITETLVFDKNSKVTIKPGTKFILSPKKSIYFYGKVLAIGTKIKPISFVAKNKNKPWGLLAIQGEYASGSQFKYVHIEDGSLDTKNLIHYTSPFNIHDVGWFEVDRCKIGRNFIGDDAMHVAYSKGVISNSEFVNARSDALDIDISDVTVSNNMFYKSGNDALDIMTTKMTASNNVFIETGDKGISVGEWSDAKVSDSLFLRTFIGVEVKDKSRVKANNLIFADSKNKAINLYNKNKRYDEGGYFEGDSIYFLNNSKVTADKLSGKSIKNLILGKAPPLSNFNWYKNMEGNSYKKLVDEVEVKYAQ